MKIFYAMIGLGAVLFGISAWQFVDASFWNWSHSVVFTLIPMMGMGILTKVALDSTEEH